MTYFNRLYALVQEIEANTARLDQADEQARKQVVRRQIPGELGTVAVGVGGPIAIDLNTRAVRYTSGAALGAAIRRTIIQAEMELRTRYHQAMADAQRAITT